MGFQIKLMFAPILEDRALNIWKNGSLPVPLCFGQCGNKKFFRATVFQNFYPNPVSVIDADYDMEWQRQNIASCQIWFPIFHHSK